jgi:hypothetical protein
LNPDNATIKTSEDLGTILIIDNPGLAYLRPIQPHQQDAPCIPIIYSLGKSSVPGANTPIVVVYGDVVREAIAVYPAEGEIIVFQPDGNDGFLYIARISPVNWSRFTKALLR